MEKPAFTGKPEGFGLMEFLVAGILAAAVLAAAGGMYFQARKLAYGAETRLQGQYALQRLSEMLKHDLSQAGRFGCASVAGHASGLRSGAVRSIPVQALDIAGFGAQSAALVLTYGRPVGVPESFRNADGSLSLSLPSAPPADMRLLAADCSGTAIWQPSGGAGGIADGLSGDGGLTVLHELEAAYAVGRMNGGEKALYRFERLKNGWEAQNCNMAAVRRCGRHCRRLVGRRRSDGAARARSRLCSRKNERRRESLIPFRAFEKRLGSTKNSGKY
ncbi:MAG: hypothetical protein Q4A49_00100 [Neisseria sp.]|nr:hypothetical protein [Neisseria sp.]